MKSSDSFILMVSIVMGCGYILYTRKSEIEKKKDVGVRLAEKITVEYFKELLLNNKNITLEESILDFEKAKIKNLNKFAISKNRTKGMYIKTYKPFFVRALKNI